MYIITYIKQSVKVFKIKTSLIFFMNYMLNIRNILYFKKYIINFTQLNFSYYEQIYFATY